MDDAAEWLEADGAGGFASGTAGLVRTRRYHAILLAQVPTRGFVLVNGLEAWVEADPSRFPLSGQAYLPDTAFPPGRALWSRSAPLRGRVGASSGRMARR